MAVVLEDLPPLLWHAELGRSLPDMWTGQRQRGVQLHDLKDAVTLWNERYHARAWLRQLHFDVTKEMEDEVLRTIARLDGKPFPTTRGLAQGWLTGRLRYHRSAETIYCAELVAVTYQAMGLLPGAATAELVRPRQVLERGPARVPARRESGRRDRGGPARLNPRRSRTAPPFLRRTRTCR